MSSLEIKNQKKNNSRKEVNINYLTFQTQMIEQQIQQKLQPNQNETEEIETIHSYSNLFQMITEEMNNSNKQLLQLGEYFSKSYALLSQEFQIEEDEDQELKHEFKKFLKTNKGSRKLITYYDKDLFEQIEDQESEQKGESENRSMENMSNKYVFAEIDINDSATWSDFIDFDDDNNNEEQKKQMLILHRHSEILKKKVEYLKEVNQYFEQKNNLDLSMDNQVLDLNEETLENQIQSYQKEVLELEKQNSIYLQQYIEERKNEQKLRKEIFFPLGEYTNTMKLYNELIDDQKDDSEQFKLGQACCRMDKLKFKIDHYKKSLVRMLVDSFLSKNLSKTGQKFLNLIEYLYDENSLENHKIFYSFLLEINITKDDWNKIEQQQKIIDYFPPSLEEIGDNMDLVNLKNVCCSQEFVNSYQKIYDYLIKNIQNDKE